MSDLDREKSDLRALIKARLSNEKSVRPTPWLSPRSPGFGPDHPVAHKIKTLPEFESATIVLLFAPLPDEPDVTPLFRAKTALVPRAGPGGLELAPIATAPGGEGWRRGRYGIWEPTAPAVDPRSVDFALVPGVAFDRACRRLGRGGGYYDRLLPTLRDDRFACGVGFDAQLVDAVPAGPRDAPLDAVVTPSGTWRRAAVDAVDAAR